MRIDLDRHRAEYHLDLLTVVPDIVASDQIGRWTAKIQELIESKEAIERDDQRPGNATILDGGGLYRHFVIDGLTVQQHLQDLMATYEPSGAWSRQ